MSATTAPPDAELSVKHHEPANLANLLNGLTAALPLLIMVATFVAVGIGHTVTEAHNRGERWWQYIIRLPAAVIVFAALSLFVITFPLWIGGGSGGLSTRCAISSAAAYVTSNFFDTDWSRYLRCISSDLGSLERGS